jgi:hypothetical protein
VIEYMAVILLGFGAIAAAVVLLWVVRNLIVKGRPW